MDCDDGIPRVVFARKQGFGFEPVHTLTQRIDFTSKLGFYVFAFTRQVKVGRNVASTPDQVGLGREHLLKAFFFAHYLLGSLRVRPQIRVGGLFIDFG